MKNSNTTKKILKDDKTPVRNRFSLQSDFLNKSGRPSDPNHTDRTFQSPNLGNPVRKVPNYTKQTRKLKNSSTTPKILESSLVDNMSKKNYKGIPSK